VEGELWCSCGVAGGDVAASDRGGVGAVAGEGGEDEVVGIFEAGAGPDSLERGHARDAERYLTGLAGLRAFDHVG
jgi:hypothetical protein